MKAEYLNKSNVSFSKGERMRLKIRWYNEMDIDNLCLRFEVKGPDRVPIATSLCDDFYSGKAGEYGEVIIEANISELVDGKYTTNYTFFERNKSGNNSNVDCVDGLDFSLVGTDELAWDVYHWGHIRLQDSFAAKVIG